MGRRSSRASLVEQGSSLGQCSFENAGSEKQQQSTNLGGGVLGDVTNLSVVPSGGPAPADMVKAGARAALSTEPFHFQSMITNSKTTMGDATELSADAKHASDPQHAMEYVPDIYKLLHKEQSNYVVSPGYMDRQNQVNAKMRGILVDWLVSVQQKYKLKSETLFLAVSLLDRHLDKKETPRKHLQLVGVTALLIAAKFEEVYPPQMKDLIYVTDKAYTSDEIVKMEVLILSTAGFDICTPTAAHFMDRYARVNECNEMHSHLAQYLLELTLVDYNMVKYSPSHLAAAALLLSNKLLRCQPSWKPEMAKHTCLTEQTLKECAKEICGLLEYAEQSSLQAVRKKFSNQKYSSVAKMSFSSNHSSAPATDEPRSSLSRRSLVDRRQSSSGAPPPLVSSAFYDRPGSSIDLGANRE
jgi:cyclin B